MEEGRGKMKKREIFGISGNDGTYVNPLLVFIHSKDDDSSHDVIAYYPVCRIWGHVLVHLRALEYRMNE